MEELQNVAMKKSSFFLSHFFIKICQNVFLEQDSGWFAL